jgi:cytochrome c oxidase subunit II
MILGENIATSSMPRDWQFGPPDAAGPAMAQICDLGRLLFDLGGAVLLLLVVALAWVAIRFNVRVHPVPDRLQSNTLMLMSWTGACIVVLVVLAIPSLLVLSNATAAPRPDLTVTAIGRTGYWTYAYPEAGDFRFDSRRLHAKTAGDNKPPNMMAVDYPMVVPVNRTVEILATGADVVHFWSVPALGVGIDAIPGRINRTWFRASKPGIYYGLCAGACGADGAIVPVAVKVVGDAEYRAWLSWAIREYAEGGVADRFAAAP